MARVKTFIAHIVLIVLLSGCNPSDYKPESYLSVSELDSVHWKIIRYIGKAPENAGDIFDKKFDDYYRGQLSVNRIDNYYIDKESEMHYFLISRLAPSLTEKRVATGGRIKFDDHNDISEYEELFRTWKMTPDTLARRAAFLFERMVNGESLDPYLTKNSNGVEYIEFPDDRVTYDKRQRKWITSAYILNH